MRLTIEIILRRHGIRIENSTLEEMENGFAHIYGQLAYLYWKLGHTTPTAAPLISDAVALVEAFTNDVINCILVYRQSLRDGVRAVQMLFPYTSLENARAHAIFLATRSQLRPIIATLTSGSSNDDHTTHATATSTSKTVKKSRIVHDQANTQPAIIDEIPANQLLATIRNHLLSTHVVLRGRRKTNRSFSDTKIKRILGSPTLSRTCI